MRGLTHEPPRSKALGALKAGQFGVFHRNQAIAIGVSEDTLHRAVKAGRLERDLPRIYRDPVVPRTWEQELMAAQLWAGEKAVLSHRTSAALLKLWGFEPGPVELTAPFARRTPRDLHIYRGCLSRADVAAIGPFRVASATRTLIDLSGVVTEEALEIALDSALRQRLTSMPYLTRRLATLGSRGRRGTGVLTRLIKARTEGPPLESPLETKFLRLIRKARLPLPRAGFEVGSYRLDFAYPSAKLGIELEGHEFHSGRRAFQHDVAKRNYFGDLGWLIVYYTWIDVTTRQQEVVERIRRHLFPLLVS